MPDVSVVLPCRNVAPWPPECIESLKAQSLRDYEVLAVNDRSTNETGAVLRNWADRDDRVRLLEVPETTPGARSEVVEHGLPNALGLAIAVARAPLLARMDGDDIAEPRRLELQRDFMDEHRGLAACGTAVELFPDPKSPRATRDMKHG